MLAFEISAKSRPQTGGSYGSAAIRKVESACPRKNKRALVHVHSESSTNAGASVSLPDRCCSIPEGGQAG